MAQPARRMPAVGTLLNTPPCKKLTERFGRDLVTFALRSTIAQAREAQTDMSEEQVVASAASIAGAIAEPSLQRVVNATGVLLHTNLGRAPLGAQVLEDIAPIATGYSNTEFDLATGKRGQRNNHVRDILTYLTGAEDALVVNNNAAALILILHNFANRKPVVVSRGELIEIGGSFRIPDIMKAGGAKMVEVGTTNKTRLADYEEALTDKTALLFKAHKSNYAIHGFTEEPSGAELAALGRERGIPVVFDLGSGLLRRPNSLSLKDEPDVRSALGDGIDLVTFSGDKLVGGPQAGIIVGRKDLIRRLAKDPLMRALRVGKLTLAALSSACRHYLTDLSLAEGNPVYAMLEQTEDQIQKRAEALCGELKDGGSDADIVASTGRTGGGALPDLEIPSRSVALELPKARAQKLHRALMRAKAPVVGVMREGRLHFDMLAVAEGEIGTISSTVTKLLR